jgi:hypothetical protein
MAGWYSFLRLCLFDYVAWGVSAAIVFVGAFPIFSLDRIIEAQPSLPSSKKEDLLALPRDA